MSDTMQVPSTYGVPVDWREARQKVEAALAEWGTTSRFQQLIVWSLAEKESVAAALHYIATMRALEAGSADE